MKKRTGVHQYRRPRTADQPEEVVSPPPHSKDLRPHAILREVPFSLTLIPTMFGESSLTKDKPDPAAKFTRASAVLP